MKPIIVDVPSIKDPIKKSPGFHKKELADFKLDIMGLCQFACKFCSSNAGNYLRINRDKFAALTEAQTAAILGVWATVGPLLFAVWTRRKVTPA